MERSVSRVCRAAAVAICVTSSVVCAQEQSAAIQELLVGNPTKAVDLLKKASEEGDANAAAYLAAAYRLGWGARIDAKDGARFAHKAAANDVPVAELMLAVEFGEQVADLSKATKRANRAAKLGDPLSEYYVGRVSEEHVGLGALFAAGLAEEPDSDRFKKEAGYISPVSKSYYEAAAKAGFAPAMLRLAQLLDEGRGYTADRKAAVQWLESAAQHDLARAQGVLGLMYVNGKGVPRDAGIGAEWARKAADKGDGPSLDVMGQLHAKGIGVARDFQRALEYFDAAIANGVGVADRHRAELETQMSSTVADNVQHRSGSPAGAVPAEDKTDQTAVDFLKGHYGEGIALAIAGIDVWLSHGGAALCKDFGISNGEQLFWAPYTATPTAAYRDERALWTYANGCLAGLSAAHASLITLLDTERAKAAGALPLPQNVIKPIEQACELSADEKASVSRSVDPPGAVEAFLADCTFQTASAAQDLVPYRKRSQ